MKSNGLNIKNKEGLKTMFLKGRFFSNEPIINKLFLLLAIFFLTIFSVLFIENYFNNNYTFRYQQTIRNQEQKQKLEFLFKENLLHIHLEFKTLSTIRHPQELAKTNAEISERIDNCRNLLRVIDQGGQFTNINTANLPHGDEITEIIEYWSDQYARTIPEVRELIPVIDDLKTLATKTISTIRGNLADSQELPENIKRIVDNSIKSADGYFTRIYETEHKIAYEIQKNVVQLNNTSINVLDRYNKLKYLSLVIFTMFAGIVTYLIIIQITKVLIFRKRAEEESHKLLIDRKSVV